MTKTQIEQIKEDAHHLFACFYEGLFTSCLALCYIEVLKMLVHAAVGIILLPVNTINGRNITSVIVQIFSYACDVVSRCLKCRAVIIF